MSSESIDEMTATEQVAHAVLVGSDLNFECVCGQIPAGTVVWLCVCVVCSLSRCT